MRFQKIILLYFALAIFSCRTPSATVKETEDIPFYPLRDENDLDLLMNDIGHDRIVLLGESSHGMSEFYTWRAAITRKLIQEKGFNLIAVEGDYTEIDPVDSFINAGSSDSTHAASVLKKITRWPEWLWSNEEFVPFVTWLNHYTQQNKPVHICGLDLFSIPASAVAVRKLSNDSLLLQASRNMEQCFSQYEQDALKYAGRFESHGSCTADAGKLNEAVAKIKEHVPKQNQFKLQQHARVVFNGEQYFKSLAKQRVPAWNTRDNHMLQTIKNLLEFYGPHSKLVIWAHNTHVGDAHYSYMSMQGKTNLGELLRKEYGRELVFIAGFGSYTGKVATADSWGGPVHIVDVPPSQKDSWEERLHRINNGLKYIRCRDLRNHVALLKWIPQRALGAVYQAAKDSQVYVPSVIPWKYDAFIYIDETHALHPLKQGEKTISQGIPIDN